jgi:hypothetical protein
MGADRSTPSGDPGAGQSDLHAPEPANETTGQADRPPKLGHEGTIERAQEVPQLVDVRQQRTWTEADTQGLRDRAGRELQTAGRTGSTEGLLKLGEEMGKAGKELGRDPKSAAMAAELHRDGAEILHAAAVQDLRMAHDRQLPEDLRMARGEAAVAAGVAALDQLRHGAETASRMGDYAQAREFRLMEHRILSVLAEPEARAYVERNPDSMAARVVQEQKDRHMNQEVQFFPGLGSPEDFEPSLGSIEPGRDHDRNVRYFGQASDALAAKSRSDPVGQYLDVRDRARLGEVWGEAQQARGPDYRRSALTTLRSSLNDYEAIGARVWEVGVHDKLAEVNRRLGDTEIAGYHRERARVLRSALTDPHG